MKSGNKFIPKYKIKKIILKSQYKSINIYNTYIDLIFYYISKIVFQYIKY